MSIYAVNGKEPIAAWIESLDPEPASSTVATDLVGSNNGTLNNFSLPSDRVSNTDAGGVRALSFSSTNRNVSFTLDGVSLVGDFSFSIWVKPSATLTANKTICQKSSGGLSLFFFNNTVFSARSQTGGVITWAIAAVEDQWTHFVFVRSGANARVWKNGVESTNGAKAFGGTFVFDRLGSIVSPSFTLIGLKDDLRIFDSAIDFTDIAYLYAGGFGRGVTEGGGSIIPILRQHYAAQGAR